MILKRSTCQISDNGNRMFRNRSQIKTSLPFLGIGRLLLDTLRATPAMHCVWSHSFFHGTRIKVEE